MKIKILAAISALMLTACTQNRPVGFERTESAFTIWNRNLKLQFQLDSIPGAVMVNGKANSSVTGLGGTAPIGTSGFYLPKNRAGIEIVDWNSERIILHESFPSWLIYDNKVRIDRQLTLYADSCFLEVFDYYYGEFDKLHIAAAVPSGCICGRDTVAASYDGLSIKVVMEDCLSVRPLPDQIVIDKEVFRNEPVHYKVYFANNE